MRSDIGLERVNAVDGRHFDIPPLPKKGVGEIYMLIPLLWSSQYKKVH
jgi:hypothetical protein